MMELLSFETVWDRCTPMVDYFTRLRMLYRDVEVRCNQFSMEIVYITIPYVHPHQLQYLFNEIQRNLHGRCRSFKLVYEAEKYGALPIELLEKSGFVKALPHQWVRQHPDFSVGAVSVPKKFGVPEWFLLIEKRSGNGVPVEACQFALHFENQLTLDFQEFA